MSAGLGSDSPKIPRQRPALLLALDRLVDEPIDRVEKQVIDADYLLRAGQ